MKQRENIDEGNMFSLFIYFSPADRSPNCPSEK